MALHACGVAHARSDPAHALEASNQGLDCARDHRQPFWEVVLATQAAGLEAEHGDTRRALALYDTAIASHHQSGNVSDSVMALRYLASTFQALEHSEVATTLYGATTPTAPPPSACVATYPKASATR